MGHGHASGPETGRLCQLCYAFCDFRLLRRVDSLHPPGYGGALSFPARAPSALVRVLVMKRNIVRLIYLSESTS